MNAAAALVLALYLGTVLAPSKANNSSDNSCTTGDGKPGDCKPYAECPRIVSLNMKFKDGGKLSADEKTYVRNSRCSVPKKGFICCEKEAEEEFSEGVRELMEQKCGEFSPIPLTVGGKEITLMSRPWMALLLFKTEHGAEDFLCGGTLITNRFVLTAAHCFENTLNKLLLVRLGDHKISTETDCGLVRGQFVCAPPPEDIEFDRVYMHENYSNVSKHNDIALIRLSREVKFQENIRPICLPVNRSLQRRADELPNFRVTGWGKTETVRFSDVPMESFVSSKKRSECQEIYRIFNREIRTTQLCAGDRGRDACNGDSGGPLMYLSKYLEVERFVQFGIVSYGSKICGNQYPGVYTNVASFIPWIADKILSK